MYVDGIVWFKYKILTSSCLIFLLVQFILIVDSAKPANPSTSRQRCSKLQSMLSYGKYQTSQISSNITYTSRIYAQNFLAYSSIDDLLIFIEPKHQINVYNAQTIQLLVNLSTTDVVIAASTTSLTSTSRLDLYFIYETNSNTNLISLRVCQVRFNMFNFNFENNFCIETIIIQYEQSDLLINGFTIKRDHAETKKSLLFISTDIGIIYTIFDTNTGSLIGESTMMNETLNEGSIVLSSSGSIYYASKQEHLIYELHIARDFRLRYGKIIKTNAIKYPFGLITDECNHLYIATRSMILIMFVQTRSTIRSVFSIASDLPITLERLNSTTYVYPTIRKQSSGKNISQWMFNFLYFTEPERSTPSTRHPVVKLEEKLDFNDTANDNASIPILWPISYPSSTSNKTKKYTKFFSTSKKSSRLRKKTYNRMRTTISIDQKLSPVDPNKLFTTSPSTEQSIPDFLDDSQLINPDDNLENDDNTQFQSQEQIDQSLDNEDQSKSDFVPDESVVPINDLQNQLKEKENVTLNQESRFTTAFTEQPSDSHLFSKYLNSTLTPLFNRTIDIAGIIYSEDDIQSYLEGRGNLSSKQETQIQAYLAEQLSSNHSLLSKYFTTTKRPTGIFISDNNISSTLQTQDSASLIRDTQSQDPASKQPLFDSKSLNGTIGITSTIFSEEDVQSYLQGRTNLSAIQEAQMQAYLAQKLSSTNNIFSTYSTTTKKPRGTFISDDDAVAEFLANESLLFDENTHMKQPPIDSSLNYKHSNHTTDSPETTFSDEDLQSYLHGRGNLSRSQEAQIEAYLAKQSPINYTIFSRYSKSTKPAARIYGSHDDNNSFQQYSTQQPSSDSELYSEHFDHIIDSNETLISDDDLKSYLEGRSNLSASQETQIQAYLARKSSSYYNIFSKYPTSTTKPIGLILPVGKSLSNSSSNDTSLFNEDSQLENYLKQLDRTIDANEILFSDDDLKSYLQGRENLSLAQKVQIQAYLAKQSSFPYNLFSIYSTSTEKPRRTLIPGHTIQPEFQRKGNLSVTEDVQSEDYSEEIFSSDPESYNRTIDSEKVFFSDDDLKSYLQGRGNLSLAQERQIQAYLVNQSPPYYNQFSKYPTSTKIPRRTLIPGHTIQPEFQRKENLSLDEDVQSEDYSEEIFSSDPESYNRTIDSEKVFFSDDDLKSYLQGHSNLSLAQKVQIQSYLAKQSSFPYNPFSKYSTSTKKPRRTSIPGHTIQPEFQRKENLSVTEDVQSEDYSEEIFPSDPESYNRTIDSEKVFFSDDDLKSYLQGHANLSLAQERQIQAYLAKQSSPYYNQFSKYRTSTKMPRRTLIPGHTIQPEFQRKGNLSVTEDVQSEDYSEEIFPSDPESYNRTIDSEKVFFSDDDLKSYLQGHANLSLAQERQIQAYLINQSSPYYNQFSNYRTSTKMPRRTSIPGHTIQPEFQRKENLSVTEDVQSEDYSEGIFSSDPESYNRTIDSEKVFFSDDDLKSYLQGRANLSQAQERQIQAYLAKQSSPYYSRFSKYLTSTKMPRRTLIPGRTIQPESQRQGNQSLTEDTQSEDYLDEPDSEEILFSEDDLRSYVEGRANLSKNQEAQIQAYLAKQTSSNQSIFSIYSKSTKLPTRIYSSDDNLHRGYPSEDTQLPNYLTKTPLFDSKYFNFSTGSEEILFSEDDLQSYLQGRGNLSLAQEAQIQTYLAKQTSLDNNTLARYFTSTRRPTKILTYDDKLQIYSERQTNRSLSEQIQSLESTAHKLASTISYTTRKRIDGGRPSQSIVNDTDAFDDNKTPKPPVIYPVITGTNHTSPDLVSISHDNTTNITPLQPGTDPIDTQIGVNQTQISSTINGTTIPSIYQKVTYLQNQSNLTNMSRLSNDMRDRLNDESMNIKRTSTLSTLIANDTVNLNSTSSYANNTLEDEFSHKHSSSLSVDINVSSTLHPLSSFALSNTTLFPSHRSHLSSPLHRPLSSSSTKSPKHTRFSSSKFFSERTKTTTITAVLSSEATSIDSKPTTVLSYSTIFPSSTSKLQSSHKFSSMQTTDATITSNIPKRKSITTLSDMSFSSLFTTHHSRFKSTITSTSLFTTDEQPFTTKFDQYTSKYPETSIETSSLPYVQSTRIFTTLVPSTNIDSSSTIMSEKTSSHSTITTTNEENIVLFDNRPSETTGILQISSTLSPSFTSKYQEELTSTQSSFEVASTSFPYFYKSKTLSTLEHVTFDKTHPLPEFTLPIMRRTSSPSTTSTISTTTERRHRTRKQKITRWQTSTTTTTITTTTTTSAFTTSTTTTAFQTTSIYDYIATTSTQMSIWPSEWNPLEQEETIIVQPPLTKNDSNVLLTNDLLNEIFNNISSSTNSTSERSIFFNLMNLPASSWNFSLNSNESIVLDVALPPATYPSYPNTTTNLTFTNIETNRFSTNINGIPINLQVDRVQTKQFSLTMNATDDDINRSPKTQSDVIIGHVKSEQFELNLTKSDNMHVRIRQVDSATAELYLDSNFCTNESSLEINLNLAKNGTIRYGNRKPLHIGPVFTRVHMLKQSCDREQPLTLFFDVCERQSPCLNGGTCLSIMPDYNDVSYIPSETGHIGYKCHCPLHSSGEHCQHLQYPLGYCLNGGSLFQIYDKYNKTIEKCICSIGFKGEHCEENIDNCIGIDCSDHGICEDGIQTYKCSCFDGFYGFNCEKTNVQTIILQAASRSFGVVAILLIAGIAGLVVASDIHTYLTRKQQKDSKIPRGTSELFENSVLLLGFSDAPIEMTDLSNVGTKKKPVMLKQQQTKRTTRSRRSTGYRQIPRRRRPLTTFPKSSSRRYLISSQSNQTIL